MENSTIQETIQMLNSFDIILLTVLLWQAIAGYRQGFRVMLYHFVKWIVLILGVILIHNLVLPMLEQQQWFVEISQLVHAWCFSIVMQFAPTDNMIAEILFAKMAESIPYARIVFFLAAVLLVSGLTKVIIIGKFWGEEPEGRWTGMLFGIAKTIALFYLLMGFLAATVGKANPEGFMAWQEGSLILSTLKMLLASKSPLLTGL